MTLYLEIALYMLTVLIWALNLKNKVCHERSFFYCKINDSFQFFN